MHNALAAPCTKIPLASSSAARVELCTCGIIHLTVGPVTVRLEASGLSGVVETLRQAERNLPRDHFEVQSLVATGSRH